MDIEEKQYTLTDLVYLAKDDPLFALTEIEKLNHKEYERGLEEHKDLSWKLKYFFDSHMGALATIFLALLTTTIIFFSVSCMKQSHELDELELQACKEGDSAKCLAGIQRAKDDPSRADLLYKVYSVSTGKKLPPLDIEK
jgi:hypothetical protein